MKKYIALTLTIITLTSVFFGCNSRNEQTDDGDKSNDGYKTAIIGYSDSLGIKGLSLEYEIQDREGFKDKKGPKKAVYKTPGGKEIVLDLSETNPTFGFSTYYPVYKYGDNIWFNPNGKLELYAIYDQNPRPTEISCSEEDVILIAKKFVNNIVNVDEYIISVSNVTDHDFYSVDFYKYVDGIKTTEYISVYVAYDGKLFNYQADMLDQFSADTKNPFDMEEVEKTVYSRLENLLKDVKDKYDKIEYVNEDFRLTRLKDGSLAILYTGEVLCHTNLGAELIQVAGELIEMLIMQ